MNRHADFAFRPIDRDALWHRMRLTRTEVAYLTQATLRQIGYWTQKGLLLSGPDERYGADALEKALLIKQALDAGMPLEQAGRAAAEYLATCSRQERTPAPHFGDVTARLRRAEEEIRWAIRSLGG